MPNLTQPLAQGLAFADIVVGISQPRVQALARLQLPVPNPVVTRAILDTGGSVTLIDSGVRQRLHLTPIRIRSILVPGHPPPIRCRYYKVRLILLHPSSLAQQNLFIPSVSVADSAVAHTGSGVLIGCDVLGQCDFHYLGRRGSYSLDY